jgi:hypothetical protein
MDDQDRWARLRGPLSFALGTVIILAELGKYLLGGLVEPQLLIVGAGFCGLPLFSPTK